MDQVDIPTQVHIESFCSTHKRKGVTPYWNCLDKELKKLAGVAQPNMDQVDIPTQVHIESLCSTHKRKGVTPYWNCLDKELANVGAEKESPQRINNDINPDDFISNWTTACVQGTEITAPRLTKKQRTDFCDCLINYLLDSGITKNILREIEVGIRHFKGIKPALEVASNYCVRQLK